MTNPHEIARLYVDQDIIPQVETNPEAIAEGAWLAAAEGHPGIVYSGSEVVFHVKAVSHHGDIYSHFHGFATKAEAEEMIERMESEFRHCGEDHSGMILGDDLDDRYWSYDRAMYGSDAYLGEVAQMTDRHRAGQED